MKIESYKEIEEKVLTIGYKDRNELKSALKSLKWHKGIFETMHESVSKNTKLTKSKAELEEAIFEIEGIMAMVRNDLIQNKELQIHS